EQRHVVLLIAADHLGGELAAVAQFDLHFAGVGDHVIVGQHIAICRDDEARAHATALDARAVVLTTGALPRHLEVRPEEAAEELGHFIVAARAHGPGLAVAAHDGGLDI